MVLPVLADLQSLSGALPLVIRLFAIVAVIFLPKDFRNLLSLKKTQGQSLFVQVKALSVSMIQLPQMGQVPSEIPVPPWAYALALPITPIPEEIIEDTVARTSLAICCGVAAGLKYALCKLGFMGKGLTRPARPIDNEPVIDGFVERFSKEFQI